MEADLIAAKDEKEIRPKPMCVTSMEPTYWRLSLACVARKAGFNSSTSEGCSLDTSITTRNFA